jgi:hypothetical protein
MGKKSKSKNTPKPTAQEIALANRSKKQFELYKRLYRPLHAELLKRTAKSPTKKAIARGLVNSDLQQQNKARSGGIHAAGLQAGYTGTSNRNVLARSGDAVHQAAVGAAGARRATQAVNTRDLQGRVNFARIGLGVAGQSLQSQAQLARNATALALEDAANETSTLDNVMTGVGGFMGAGGAGAFGGGGGNPAFQMSQLNAGGRSMR